VEDAREALWQMGCHERGGCLECHVLLQLSFVGQFVERKRES
jgi:hypothetical protein